MQQKMKNPAGRRGFSKGMKHFQGWAQCFTAWAICQDWVMVAAGQSHEIFLDTSVVNQIGFKLTSKRR